MDRALTVLRGSRWRPHAWLAFLCRSGVRSAEQARTHPLAALEVTALHVVLLAPSRRLRPQVAVSWALAITHLGCWAPRGGRSGPPTPLSLLRANLPAGRWTPLVAVGADVADGWLDRLATPTAFGAYADPLADMTYWTRQVRAREPSRALRAAVGAIWLLPLSAIGAAYFAAGRAIDYPRPLVVRGCPQGSGACWPRGP